MKRGWSVLTIKVIYPDMKPVRCLEEVSYYCKLRAVEGDMDDLKWADGVDLSMPMFDKTFLNMHLLRSGRLRSYVLEL